MRGDILGRRDVVEPEEMLIPRVWGGVHSASPPRSSWQSWSLSHSDVLANSPQADSPVGLFSSLHLCSVLIIFLSILSDVLPSLPRIQ